MPEHIRALVVILILASSIYAFAHRSACAISDAGDFIRRRNLWFALTLLAFLAHSFLVYSLISMLLLAYAVRHDYNPPALFFSLMFILPVAIVQIPGLGLVNYIFEISHLRILALAILLPAFFSQQRDSDNLSFGRSAPDKAIIGYLALTIMLMLIREPSMTNTFRQIFYIFIDIFLPYFVISRALKSLQAFRDALLSLVLAIMVLASIATFEFFKHWLLYAPVLTALDLKEGMTGYLGRDGMLRVSASAGQPIVLGYLMAVGMGFYLFLQKSIKQKFIRRSGFALLAIGLVVPLSRGPWLGAVMLLIVFVSTGRNPVPRLMSLALAGMLALALIALLPGGERVINLLPFIGTTEKGNVDYRENLITNSIIVIQRNPWFGSSDFLESPEMEAMRQGQGIIDIVNSYIVVTLKTGFFGLGLFVGFFALTLLGILRAMHSIPDKESDEYLLGRALISTLSAILLIILTVSSITFVPIVYWCVAGMGVAYVQMVRRTNALT